MGPGTGFRAMRFINSTSSELPFRKVPSKVSGVSACRRTSAPCGVSAIICRSRSRSIARASGSASALSESGSQDALRVGAEERHPVTATTLHNVQSRMERRIWQAVLDEGTLGVGIEYRVLSERIQAVKRSQRFADAATLSGIRGDWHYTSQPRSRCRRKTRSES